MHAERNFPDDVVAVYEDDFFWSKREDLIPRLRSACRYVREHIDSVHHYYLGGIPYPSIHALKRFVTRHVRSPIAAVHAALHTPIGIQRYLSYMQTDICSIGFCDAFMGARAHMHNVPLAYQLFPNTPSQREWWPQHLVWCVRRAWSRSQHSSRISCRLYIQLYGTNYHRWYTRRIATTVFLSVEYSNHIAPANPTSYECPVNLV